MKCKVPLCRLYIYMCISMSGELHSPHIIAHCSKVSNGTLLFGKLYSFKNSMFWPYESLMVGQRSKCYSALMGNSSPVCSKRFLGKLSYETTSIGRSFPKQTNWPSLVAAAAQLCKCRSAEVWCCLFFFAVTCALTFIFVSSFSFHIISAIKWCTNSTKLVRFIENFPFTHDFHMVF